MTNLIPLPGPPAHAGSWPHPRWGEGPYRGSSRWGAPRSRPRTSRCPSAPGGDGGAPLPAALGWGVDPHVDAQARHQLPHPAGAHPGHLGLGDHLHHPRLAGAAPGAGEVRALAQTRDGQPRPGVSPSEPVAVAAPPPPWAALAIAGPPEGPDLAFRQGRRPGHHDDRRRRRRHLPRRPAGRGGRPVRLGAPGTFSSNSKPARRIRKHAAAPSTGNTMPS